MSKIVLYLTGGILSNFFNQFHKTIKTLFTDLSTKTLPIGNKKKFQSKETKEFRINTIWEYLFITVLRPALKALLPKIWRNFYFTIKPLEERTLGSNQFFNQIQIILTFEIRFAKTGTVPKVSIADFIRHVTSPLQGEQLHQLQCESHRALNNIKWGHKGLAGEAGLVNQDGGWRGTYMQF